MVDAFFIRYLIHSIEKDAVDVKCGIMPNLLGIRTILWRCMKGCRGVQHAGTMSASADPTVLVVMKGVW